MMKPVAMKMFYLFTMFSFFLYRGYYYAFPAEETIQASVPSPVHKESSESGLMSRAFKLFQTSGDVRIETGATENESSYLPSWIAAWWSLPQDGSLQLFYRILALLTCIFIIFLSLFMMRRHAGRGGVCKEDEKKKLAALAAMLQEWEGEGQVDIKKMLDSINVVVELTELTLSSADKVQTKKDQFLKEIQALRDERHTNLESREKIEKKGKHGDESQIAVEPTITRTKVMGVESRPKFQNKTGSTIDSMEVREDNKTSPAKARNEVESQVQDQQTTDSTKLRRVRRKWPAEVQKDLDWTKAIMKEAEHKRRAKIRHHHHTLEKIEEKPAHSQNDEDSTSSVSSEDECKCSQHEVAPLESVCKRTFQVTQEHTGHPAPTSSSRKMGIKVKKGGIKNVRVGSAPPSNVKTVKAKVASVRKVNHKPNETKTLTYKMPDYSKVQAKVSTGRK
jgi:hypothetical protein